MQNRLTNLFDKNLYQTIANSEQKEPGFIEKLAKETDKNGNTILNYCIVKEDKKTIEFIFSKLSKESAYSLLWNSNKKGLDPFEMALQLFGKDKKNNEIFKLLDKLFETLIKENKAGVEYVEDKKALKVKEGSYFYKAILAVKHFPDWINGLDFSELKPSLSKEHVESLVHFFRYLNNEKITTFNYLNLSNNPIGSNCENNTMLFSPYATVEEGTPLFFLLSELQYLRHSKFQELMLSNVGLGHHDGFIECLNNKIDTLTKLDISNNTIGGGSVKYHSLLVDTSEILAKRKLTDYANRLEVNCAYTKANSFDGRCLLNAHDRSDVWIDVTGTEADKEPGFGRMKRTKEDKEHIRNFKKEKENFLEENAAQNLEIRELKIKNSSLEAERTETKNSLRETKVKIQETLQDYAKKLLELSKELRNAKEEISQLKKSQATAPSNTTTPQAFFTNSSTSSATATKNINTSTQTQKR